jgi:PAS domain S-box-containing protein
MADPRRLSLLSLSSRRDAVAAADGRTPRPGRPVVLLALLTLGSLAVLVVACIRLSADAAENQAEDQVASAAAASAEAVRTQMQGLADVVEAFAQRPSLRAAMEGSDPTGTGREELRFHLGELRNIRPGIDLAFVSDPNGVLVDILPETPGLAGRDFRHRDWYQGVLRSNRPYVSEVYETAAAGGGIVVAAAAPIRAGTASGGPTAGILVAAQRIARVQAFVDGFAAAQQVHLTVTDQQGVVVVSSGRAPEGLVSYRDDASVAAALAGRSGTDRLRRGGENVVSAHLPVAGLGWALVADLPSDLALREMGTLRAAILGLAAVLAVVMSAGLWLLRRSLVRRAAAEDELQRSTAFLDSVVENIPNMVFVKEATDLRFVRFNRAGEELLGFPREDLLGKNDHDFFPAGEADFFIAKDREVLERGVLLDIPAEPIQTRERGERILHTRKIPILGPDGAPRYLLGISDDVTDRRHAEAALEAARAAADQANQAKNQFLSRMSHELRTPLNAVLGFGQLLQLEELDRERRESVDQIVRAGSHLMELIDEVLDISRMESGQLRLSLEPVEVCEVVSEAFGMVTPLAAARHVRLVPNLPACAGVYVRADRQRLRQVVVNLLVNGVKYNREGGRVRVSCAPGPGRMRLQVEDTGMGVARADLDRLFQPFERLGAEQTDVEGTGLGLALAKQLMEVMGGSIGVESELGKGSSFWVELPTASPQTEGQTDIPSAPARSALVAPVPVASGSRVVLYVEDNLSNVKLVERVVARRPEVRLLVAMQGSLALDLARQHQPALVLLDLHLPDMSGEEVLRRLKADPRTAAIPVVVLSADATPGQVERLRAEGAAEYVTKPFNIPRLLAMIDGATPAPATVFAPAEGLVPPSGPIAGNGVLDEAMVAALQELAGDGGGPGMRDAVATFLDEGASRLAALRVAVSGGDVSGAERLAHSLAGSSAAFGARDVADRCRRLEADARARDLERAPELVDEVAAQFDAAAAALRATFLDGDGRLD